MERLLGRAERDPRCEAAFEQFERYCEAVLAGLLEPLYRATVSARS